MKILIIEDEQRAAERLKTLLNEINQNFEVISIMDSIDDSVRWFQSNPHPDLILLDIQLSDGLSFNIFKQVKIKSPIIFTTAYDEYALRAFELNSIDYLLKPIAIDKLKNSIKKYQNLKNDFWQNNNVDFNKILSNISLNSKVYKTRFLINKSDSLQIVGIDEIAYFYSEDKVTFIITKGKKRYIIDDSLDKIGEEIDPSLFFRINRQILLSIDAISKINNHFNYKLKLVLSPEREELNTVISRAKVREFKDWVSKTKI